MIRTVTETLVKSYSDIVANIALNWVLRDLNTSQNSKYTYLLNTILYSEYSSQFLQILTILTLNPQSLRISERYNVQSLDETTL